MPRFSHLRVHCAVVALALGTLASSLAAQADRVQTFDVAAGPLSNTLRAIARQSGQAIAFASRLTDGLIAPAVTGQMDTDAALSAALAGSGLAAVEGRGGLVIRRKQSSRDESQAGSEILVTGTRIRGSGPIGTPLTVIDRRAIDESGRATIADLVQTIPQNYGGGQTEGTAGGNTARNFASTNTGFGTGINLRGLGASSTLTLLDGSRPPLSGDRASFSDVSLIPAIAIDRIEILTDGASSIYGSDAVAGVVNLRFRNRFQGTEAGFFSGTADGDFSQEQASLITGRRWSSGGVVVAYQYDYRGALPAADRSYATEDLTRFGGPDNRDSYTLPATIIAADGSTYSATKVGSQTDPLTSADLVGGAINKRDGVRLTDLLPRQESHAVFLSADQDLAAGASLFARVLWAHRTFSAAALPAETLVTVTPANPFYVDPLGTGAPIYVEHDFSGELGEARASGRVTGFDVTAGVRGDIGRWHYEVSGGLGRQHELNEQSNFPNTARLAAAAAQTDPAQAFDPFGPNGASILDAIRGSQQIRTRYTVWTSAARLDGPLFELPAGALKLAFGAEYRHEGFVGDELDDLSYSAPNDIRLDVPPEQRHITAEYAELAIPVLASAGFPGRLDLSASGRIEQYSDFGSTRNPKIGGRWEPVAGLALRGSWGTSFRAPNLLEKGNPAENVFYGTYLPDPSSPTGQTAVIDKSGYAQSIGPERATTWTAGLDLKPAALPGLVLGATYFHTNYRDRIGTGAYDIYSYLAERTVYGGLIEDNPSAAEIAAYFADPRFVNLTGITPGQVKVITDGTVRNLSENRIRGVDFNLAYSQRLGGGALETSLSGTRLLSYKVKATAIAAAQELVSTYGSPVRLRMRGSLGWHDTRFDASGAVNYTSSYRNTLLTPAQAVSSWTTLDLVIGATIARAGRPGALHLGLSATNLLNTKPPYIANVQVSSTEGYDAQSASPVGRLVAVQGRVSW